MVNDPWLKADDVQPFLAQTDHWKNRDNELIPLSEIDPWYALAITRFLERRAPDLMEIADEVDAYAEMMMDEGGYSLPRTGRIDPVNWMQSTKLYQAFLERTKDVSFF